MYMKVATQNGDKLSDVVKSIDANEIRVIAAGNVPDSASLYRLWSCKVPPEFGKDAVSSCGVQAKAP